MGLFVKVELLRIFLVGLGWLEMMNWVDLIENVINVEVEYVWFSLVRVWCGFGLVKIWLRFRKGRFVGLGMVEVVEEREWV